MARQKNLGPNNEVMPPNMFYRAPFYYVRRKINGRLRKKSTGKRDFKSALRRYHEIMKRWNDGASGWEKQDIPTLAQYWTNSYRPAYTVRKTPRPNGTFQDDQLIRVVLKDLGHLQLDDFTKTVCQRWANRRRGMTYTFINVKKKTKVVKQISEGTVTREVNLISAVFTQAREDGYVQRNPWRTVEREQDNVKKRVLTPEEQTKLEAVMEPRYVRWMQFMLGTGLREAEARGINPELDLNLEERWVRVTRKTRGLRKKIQQVPLFDQDVIEVLQEQLDAEHRLWPQNASMFRYVLNKGALDAGIPHLSPHTLRHTFGTRYLQAGGDIYRLSLLMGHASVKVTEKVYAHLLKEDLLEASKHIRLGVRPAKPAKVLAFEVK